jgi:hypothetical protein
MTDEERAKARVELLAKALAIYERLAKGFPETAVGAEAEAAAKRLAALPELANRADAESSDPDEARQWLAVAQNLIRAGRLGPARKYLERVLAEYPKSPQAGLARDLLEAMSRK